MIKVMSLALVMMAQPVFASSADCIASFAAWDHLKATLKMSRQSIGVTDNGSVIEVWADTVSGEWVIIATDPSAGVSCVAAHGGAFSHIPNV